MAEKTVSVPPHPGSLVRAVVEGLGLSINAFARKLNVAPSTVHRIVTERAAISPEMAVRLSVTVGDSADSWMQHQVDYDLWNARKRVDVSQLPVLRG
ncbi:MAG: HigA family addiction module antidote protein [Oxalobacter sp.]|nr:HigA family addiction module antidote protein [Oxalobacter sp.]